MAELMNELLKEFNKIDKELNDLYHETALRMNLSDSAFSIFYVICSLGDGCLQKDICYETFANKQTVHSSIRGRSCRSFGTVQSSVMLENGACVPQRDGVLTP